MSRLLCAHAQLYQRRLLRRALGCGQFLSLHLVCAVVAAQGIGGVELLLAEAAGVGSGLEVQAEDVLALHRLRLEGGAAEVAEEGAL